MLSTVPTTPKRLVDYQPIVGEVCIDEIRRLAAGLRGARVLHLTTAAFGGGVTEILAALVPLMQDLGLAAGWQVMRGADEFFAVTRAMQTALQGTLLAWTPQMRESWLRHNRLSAELLDESFDFVVVHNPPPAAILAGVSERLGRRPAGRWIWRCHLDTTDAQPDVWDLLHASIERYDAAVFTMAEEIRDDIRQPRLYTIPPAIDPLSPRSIVLSPESCQEVLRRYQVDPERPLLLQVSCFEPWNDAVGVIDIYRALKSDFPDLQLAVIASLVRDDPVEWAWYERMVRHAGEDDDIHILSNLNGVGSVEVNAFQRGATVIVQRSLRDGLGPAVAEGLWKGRPVVAGSAGSIPLLIRYGETGYLANTTPEYANRVAYLLRHPTVATRMGALGREDVRAHFLITRSLRDYLALFTDLQGVLPADQLPAAMRARSAASLTTDG